ncbi:MAG: hypothetical protein P1T08_14155 [Acidimicrobiia bacterium]|nr:hypothetical protein [Acidimicrobiia bacterium]
MQTICPVCSTLDEDGAASCTRCGTALATNAAGLAPARDAGPSPGKRIFAVLLGAVAAGLFGSGAPLAAAVVLGGVVGWLLVERRSSHGAGDPAADFLRRAAARRVIDDATAQRLLIHRSWESGAEMPVPQLEDLIPPPPDHGPASTQPPILPPLPTRPIMPPLPGQAIPDVPAPAAVPKEPRPTPDWVGAISGAWAALRSDLAVHGLAYLGVLFVFVGVVGFVIFAFSGVGSSLRPVAEVTIPLALFGSAAFLRRARTPFVAGALELLGGLLTPVVLFAAFADGAPIPPDPGDEALVVTLTIVSLLLASGYAWFATRSPRTSLRFLVAPMVWTGAGVVGLAFERGTSAAQFAAVTVAVAATTLVAGRFTDNPIGQAASAVAVAGGAGGFGLTLLFAATSDWPPVPMLVAAAAVVLVVDLRRHTIPWPWAWQLAVGAAGAIAIAQTWDPSPVGAVTALGALGAVELWTHRGVSSESTLAALAVYVVAMLASAEQWLLTATVAGAGWAHYRRIRPLAAGLRPVLQSAGAVLPLLAVGALNDWAGPDIGWPIVTGFVLLVALLVRSARSDDTYLTLWMLGAATLLLIGSAIDNAHPAVLIAMSLGAAAVFLLIGRGPGFGIWAPSAAVAWAAVQIVWAFAIDPRWAPVVLAIGGVAAVGWSSTVRSSGHIGAIGHLAGVAALGWRTDGWWLVAVLGAITGGAVWSIVVGERSAEGRLFGLLSRVVGVERSSVGAGLTLVAASLIPMWFISILSASVEDSARWVAVVAAGWGLTAAAGSRLLGDRPHLGPIVAWSAFVWSVLGASAALGSRLPEMITLSLLAATIVAIETNLRHPLMTWTGWAATGGLALSVARHSGVADADLHRVLLIWGSVMVLAALTVRRQQAPYGSDRKLIDRLDVLPAVSLGAVGALIGTGVELVRPPDVMWPWIIGAALVAGAASALAAMGALSGLGWALLTAGVWSGAYELDWLTGDRVWPAAVWAGLLCASAAGLTRFLSGVAWWKRWDLPPFVVAHGAAAAAIAAAVWFDDIPLTWAAFGVLATTVAVGLRRWIWTFGAATLFIGAAWVAGDGWLTLALLALSAASASLAMFSDEPIASRLNSAAAVFGLSGWAAAITWQEWWPDPAIAATAVGAGCLALALALVVRARPSFARVTAPWAVVALVGEMAAIATGGAGDRLQTGSGLAAGLALWAIGLGLAASPLQLPWLRDVTVIPALGSGVALIYARQPNPGVSVAVVAAVGLVLALAGGWLKANRESVWGRPVLFASAGADLVAGITGLTLLPETWALIVVLVAVGIKLLGAGLVLPSPVALGGSVWSFTAAWVLFALEAADGNPQWFAVPVGLAVTVTSDLTRRRAGTVSPTGTILVYLDALAALLILGPSLVQTVQISVAYGLLVMLLGTLLAGWGLLIRIRRRLVIGSGGVVTGALLLVVVPLARVIPQFRGPALWATVIVLGVALIGAAVGLERGRSTVRVTVQKLRDLTSDWD